ncbi:DUF3693 domain-containing protein [Oxalicibacterium faecigallinarum]|uniref:Uncharacterized protein n=1 Tax=Oxalicibacterium faecigallinarum TaxID=573741 RepID=A0A8J3AVF3_9BURK|nr:DUF3693 domain-containing protein [Oxalicibacterium faecigallinarum]GGI16923.1 hypothetical protein GCM10008066_06390 [Oxalicibacterium faecigallinarum]
MNTLQYLDAVKATLNIESDYAVAKALGIRTSTISNYRARGGQMDDDVARKVAKIIGKHPGIVTLDIHRERANSPEDKAMWKEIFEGFHALSLRANSIRGSALLR